MVVNPSFQAEREEVRTDMMTSPVDQLSPPLTEPQIIHKLIAQYLAHDGYIETARAFAAEVRQEHHSLAVGTTGAGPSSQDLEPEEDVDAIHRQSNKLLLLNYVRTLTWHGQKYDQQSSTVKSTVH